MKWKSILAIIGILLFGFAIGFITSGYLAKHRFDKKRSKDFGKRLEEHLYRRLELDDKQKEATAPVVQKYMKIIKEHHDSTHKSRLSIFDSLQVELTPTLNEDQKVELSKTIERLKIPPHKRKFRKKGRHGKKGG